MANCTFRATVQQIEEDDSEAVAWLKQYLSEELHGKITDYLQDMSESVDDDVVYNGLELLGDFMMWNASIQ
jgi:hypothetical protein